MEVEFLRTNSNIFLNLSIPQKKRGKEQALVFPFHMELCKD